MSVALTSHVSEFLTAGFQVVPVLGLNSILNGTGYWVVGAEDCTLNELDLASGITLEATASGCGTTRLDSLSPSFGGAGVAPVVRRGNARRFAVSIGRRLLHVAGSGVALAIGHAAVGICFSQAVGRGWPWIGGVKAIRCGVGIAKRAGSSAHGVAVKE
jgi:hypothetical protein